MVKCYDCTSYNTVLMGINLISQCLSVTELVGCRKYEHTIDRNDIMKRRKNAPRIRSNENLENWLH